MKKAYAKVEVSKSELNEITLSEGRQYLLSDLAAAISKEFMKNDALKVTEIKKVNHYGEMVEYKAETITVTEEEADQYSWMLFYFEEHPEEFEDFKTWQNARGQE